MRWASGKADLVALGRSLVADPEWVAKLARGERHRSCLACNTCINEMRGGARIGCVVNGCAGQETRYRGAAPTTGARIAVIGAGPAGLSYASLVAAGNSVTVFRARPCCGRRVPLCRNGAALSGGRGQSALPPALYRPTRRFLACRRA